MDMPVERRIPPTLTDLVQPAKFLVEQLSHSERGDEHASMAIVGSAQTSEGPSLAGSKGRNGAAIPSRKPGLSLKPSEQSTRTPAWA